MGRHYRDHGFVFAAPTGEPLHPDYPTRRFRRLVTQADLPPVRLHDLRHGAATLTLAGGADLKVVQNLLGHSTIVLTADTCTSVLPGPHQPAPSTSVDDQDEGLTTVRGRTPADLPTLDALLTEVRRHRADLTHPQIAALTDASHQQPTAPTGWP